MKFLSWLFSFGDRYYELQQSYENSRYPFFRFLLLVITAALPALALEGAMAIGFSEAWFATVLLIIMFFMLLVKTPKDLFILSLVALSHGFWILADRKKPKTELEENIEEYTDKKKEKVKWEKNESNPVWDFLMGVLGIILAFAAIAVPFILFFGRFQ